MKRIDWQFWYYQFKHWIKYRNKKYQPKSPLQVYNTIVIYGFGLDNYKFIKGRYIRLKR